MLLVTALLWGCSCKDNDNSVIKIPAKISPTSTSPLQSPVNTKNIDSYMFRDDVQYVDLRSSEMILEEGYIAGFEFVPFYDIIASFSKGETLYQMKNITQDDGSTIAAGQIGGFIAQYEESNRIIKSLFDEDKYIFFVSQGGSESSYIINLLIQLGYNGNLLYNIGGVMNTESVPSYSSIQTNKYFVEGQGNLDVSINYNLIEGLTRIEN